MRRSKPLLILTILLSLAGAAISYNLLVKHLDKTSGLAWFDSTCEAGDDEESNRSCDQVMASVWGTFPPVPSDVAAEKRYERRSVLGLFEMRPRPVALFGMLYFSVMAAWYLAVGGPSYRRRFWHLIPLVLNVLGVVSALFFSYIMFFTDLEAWCPWCMVAHVCNGVMLVGAILLWPRPGISIAEQHVGAVTEGVFATKPHKSDKITAPVAANPRPPVAAACQADPSTATQPISHPAGRLIVVALAGIAALTAAEWYYYDYVSELRAHKGLRTAFAKLDREMDQVRSHAKTLYSMFQKGEKKEIPLRDDDPVKNPGPDRLVAVVISDFRCPHCSRFAEYMKEVVEPMFGDKLAVTFKHFPADTTCNRRIRKTLHSKACLASEAVEAARMLGGTQGFWKAHDLLMESQDQLRDDDFYAELAGTLGFDNERFVEAMESQAVKARIAEDIELAVNIGLRGTPAVYVEGRQVPSFSREQDVFWKEVKRHYERRMRSQRRNNTAGRT